MIVYTKEQCSQCEAAKNLLRTHNVEFNEIRIGPDIDRHLVLVMFPGVKMVPIIVDPDNKISKPELQQLANYVHQPVARANTFH